MSKRSILIQLDCDEHPSVFDSVVAVDSGVDELFRYSHVIPARVRDLVHGAIFTRGPRDLCRTAVFVGGSNVELAQDVHAEVRKSMIPQFGLTVSTMMDANGCNTTAVAAVRTIMKSVDCGKATALIMAGTGPVGRRVASLLAGLGCKVLLASRQLTKACAACAGIQAKWPGSAIEGIAPESQSEIKAVLENCHILVGCGAAGVNLVAKGSWIGSGVRVVIDLNGVPPGGLEGVSPADSGVERDGAICHGAIGVGSLKMKLHRKCIASLFETNQLMLDEDSIFSLSASLPEA